MNLVTSSRRMAAAAAFAFLALAQPAAAQDVADTHLAAARAALSAIKATEDFDTILPQAAHALKSEMIQKNPDLQATIIEVVDQTALSLASRRGDLEREAALIYAKLFSEEELRSIADFYASDAGKKLIEHGPNAVREVYQAAEIWQRGVARDLSQLAGAELAKRFGGAQPEEGGQEEGSTE